jgi:hypothetical protein
MACYLVSYNSAVENARFSMSNDIRAYGSWAKIGDSAYIISTDAEVTEVYDNLSKNLDADDNFYVISVSKPCWGQGPGAVNQWLSDNIPN